MPLFDANAPLTLEDVFNRQADTATMGIEQNAAKKRRRLIGQQAASGRLGSGVANYSLADADTAELNDIGGVSRTLADVLGQVPAEDYGASQDFDRQVQLAKLIGKKNKPSGLASALGGIGGGAATGAAVGGVPGALIGGTLGGVLGGLS